MFAILLVCGAGRLFAVLGAGKAGSGAGGSAGAANDGAPTSAARGTKRTRPAASARMKGAEVLQKALRAARTAAGSELPETFSEATVRARRRGGGSISASGAGSVWSESAAAGCGVAGALFEAIGAHWALGGDPASIRASSPLATSAGAAPAGASPAGASAAASPAPSTPTGASPAGASAAASPAP